MCVRPKSTHSKLSYALFSYDRAARPRPHCSPTRPVHDVKSRWHCMSISFSCFFSSERDQKMSEYIRRHGKMRQIIHHTQDKFETRTKLTKVSRYTYHTCTNMHVPPYISTYMHIYIYTYMYMHVSCTCTCI